MDDIDTARDPKEPTEGCPSEIANTENLKPPPNAEENADANETEKDAKANVKNGRPLLVRVLSDDELRPFEQRTLNIARQTYRLTAFAVLAAIIGAIFVYVQMRELGDQNQILAAQTESGAAGAIINESNMRQQLKIAQQQAAAALSAANTARQSLEIQSRPWVSLQNFRLGQGMKALDTRSSSSWPVSYEIINTGRSPATRVIVSSFIYTRGWEAYTAWRQVAPCSDADREAGNLKIPSDTIFPDSPLSVNESVSVKPPASYPSRGFPMAKNFIVVCISYREAFSGKVRHTKMLFHGLSIPMPRGYSPLTGFDLVGTETN